MQVYCSPATAALLRVKWPALGARLVELPVGETTHLEGQGAAEGVGGWSLAVTPLDAGHCPGSVCFVFEGDFGRVVHTGDYRLDGLTIEAGRKDSASAADAAGWLAHTAPEAASALRLHPELTRAPVDELWLDDTYLLSGADFPPRVRVLEAVVDAARRAVQLWTGGAARPMHLYVGVDSLGKEELLMALAQALGVPAEMDARRLTAARALGLSPKLVRAARAGGAHGEGAEEGEEEEATACGMRLIVVSRREMQGQAGIALVARARASGKAAIGLLPTGFAHREATARDRRGAAGALVPDMAVPRPSAADPHVLAFPYSLHSPPRELRAFVAALTPVRVRSVTRGGACITARFPVELGPEAAATTLLPIAPPAALVAATEASALRKRGVNEAARVVAHGFMASRPRAKRPRAPGAMMPRSPPPRPADKEAAVAAVMMAAARQAAQEAPAAAGGGGCVEDDLDADADAGVVATQDPGAGPTIAGPVEGNTKRAAPEVGTVPGRRRARTREELARRVMEGSSRLLRQRREAAVASRAAAVRAYIPPALAPAAPVSTLPRQSAGGAYVPRIVLTGRSSRL